MTTEEAIIILSRHQMWRKGAEMPMEDPVRLGMAIDLVLTAARESLQQEKKLKEEVLYHCKKQ